MGNNPDKLKRKELKSSQYSHRISEFLDRYGRLSSEQAKPWVNKVYSDNLYSVTITKYAAPTYRKSKEELLQAFQKAYEGQWRPSLIEITDVSIDQATDEETISWKFVNNVPMKDNKNKRVNLYFKVDSVFDRKSDLWTRSNYEQYVPTPPQQHIPQLQPSSSSSQSSSSSNDEARRRRAAQEAAEDAARRQKEYDDAQARFRENQRRQQEAQREYQRQQQLQAEQRLREAQQAIIKNQKW